MGLCARSRLARSLTHSPHTHSDIASTWLAVTLPRIARGPRYLPGLPNNVLLGTLASPTLSLGLLFRPLRSCLAYLPDGLDVVVYRAPGVCVAVGLNVVFLPFFAEFFHLRSESSAAC